MKRGTEWYLMNVLEFILLARYVEVLANPTKNTERGTLVN